MLCEHLHITLNQQQLLDNIVIDDSIESILLYEKAYFNAQINQILLKQDSVELQQKKKLEKELIEATNASNLQFTSNLGKGSDKDEIDAGNDAFGVESDPDTKEASDEIEIVKAGGKGGGKGTKKIPKYKGNVLDISDTTQIGMVGYIFGQETKKVMNGDAYKDISKSKKINLEKKYFEIFRKKLGEIGMEYGTKTIPFNIIYTTIDSIVLGILYIG